MYCLRFQIWIIQDAPPPPPVLFGYQLFSSIWAQNSSWHGCFAKVVPIFSTFFFFSVLWTQESLGFGEGEAVGVPSWRLGGRFCPVRMNSLVFNMCGISCASMASALGCWLPGKGVGCWQRLLLWSILKRVVIQLKAGPFAPSTWWSSPPITPLIEC